MTDHADTHRWKSPEKPHHGVRNSGSLDDSMVITQLAPRSSNCRGRDTEGVASMPAEHTPRLKYKLAQRVIFTTFGGDRFPGRVVDASRDHVTVILYGGPNRGRTFRVEGNDIARCIARDTRRRW